VVAVGSVGLAFRGIAAAKARWLAKGLSVLRSQRGSARLVAFVLIAVFAQIARNWLMLNAVGVDASVFDAVAVLIAVVSLGQLPFGLSVGAAAAVLILGPQGVAAATAAGVLLTATGTVGGLAFATWALLDLAASRWLTPIPAGGPWSVLAALPAAHCRAIEGCYFGGLSHLQITRVLGVAPA
jgi:hypothetical protein